MKEKKKTNDRIAPVLVKFEADLRIEEKSGETMEKYMREAKRFLDFVCTVNGVDKNDEDVDKIREGSKREEPIADLKEASEERPAKGMTSEEYSIYAGKCSTNTGGDSSDKYQDICDMVTKEAVIAYKEKLKAEGYTPSSINVMLSGIRALLSSMGKDDIEVKNLKTQQQSFASEENILTKNEYLRMINVVKYGIPFQNNEPGNTTEESKLYSFLRTTSMIMETICSTGIRVSELKNFTVEAVKEGCISVDLKSKERKILITGKLKKKLLRYAKEKGIRKGVIFINKKGNPIHRSQIWQMMKTLCRMVGVDEKKVFPHNLRKLFARVFYEVKKDIAKLADVLGHSSINTTRRYIMTSAKEHIKQMERLGLVT